MVRFLKDWLLLRDPHGTTPFDKDWEWFPCVSRIDFSQQRVPSWQIVAISLLDLFGVVIVLGYWLGRVVLAIGLPLAVLLWLVRLVVFPDGWPW